MIGHRISRTVLLRTLHGLTLAPPVETWIQLGSVLSLDDLIVAADALMRRKRPLSDLEQLTAALTRANGRPGIRRLREAVVYARSGTDSPRETQTRLIIVRAGLPEPQIGFEVYNEHGEFVGTPDLAYVQYRIALEYEGDGHRENTIVFRDDIERAEQFQDADWRYVRVTADHLANPHRLVERVRSILFQRGWRP